MRSWESPVVPALPPAAGRLVLGGRAVGPAAGTARLYVCGITPYDATHMGHAFTYVTFDLVVRQWRDLGLDVAYTQNVTDVDDPLLERAQAQGVDWAGLAADQIELFRHDMAALRVVPPDHYLGVVESLPLIWGLIGRLQDAGAVYQVDDPDHPDWYCTNALDPGFGSLSGLGRDAMLAEFAEHGGDPERPGKRDPLDALVWRLARPGEPQWDSPFGWGRPGWHVECVALALATLGPDFDLQGGGGDLRFPHHEMCAAQAFTATGRPLARAYVQSAMVGLDGEKMSKSKGNLVLVSRLRERGVDPMAIRLALLAHHYRDDWSWTEEELQAAEQRLATWRAAVGQVDGPPVCATTGPPVTATNRANLPERDRADVPARDRADVLARDRADVPLVGAIRAALRDDLHADRALLAVDAWAQGGPDDPAERAEVAAAVDALLGVGLLA